MSRPAKTREQLILECQGLVRSLAWQIHRKLPPCVDLEDLIGCGQIGLAEAARDYDPNRAEQFTTFSYFRIRAPFFDGLSKMNWFRRADYDRGLYPTVPSHDILVSGVDKDGSSIELRETSSNRNAEQDTPLCREVGQLLDDGVVGDQTSTSPSPPDVVAHQEMVEKLHELLETLPEQERSLIQGAYFEGLSLKDAGTRVGISKAWASRLHVKTLDKLAHSFRKSRMAD